MNYKILRQVERHTSPLVQMIDSGTRDITRIRRAKSTSGCGRMAESPLSPKILEIGDLRSDNVTITGDGDAEIERKVSPESGDNDEVLLGDLLNDGLPQPCTDNSWKGQRPHSATASEWERHLS